MENNIAALKRKMLVKYPFFGSIVANAGYKESNDVPTAATDGEIIYYNPEYLKGLSVEEQTFIMAHEVCHIAFNHILRSEDKDPMLWNIATDGVINQFLKRDGLKMVPGGVDIEDAINYDAEQLYEKLLQEKQQDDQQQGDNQEQQNNQQQGNSKEDKIEQDVGHDTHSMWKQAVKKHKEHENEETELEKKQEELEEMGEQNAFKKNLEDKKEQLEELKEEILKKASQAGTSTNGGIRTVTDIGTAKPLIDWRYVLREAIKYNVDWSYKNATLEDGVVTANLEEQPVPETEIVLDTSGSIDEVLLRNFLRECKNILKHSKLKVGCCDTKFYGFNEIKTEKDIENMQFQGGGGTNFDVAINAFSRRVENKIIFTDGEAPMPQIPLDAIWIVFGGKINPKGGKVINITPEQLEELYSYKQDQRWGKLR